MKQITCTLGAAMILVGLPMVALGGTTKSIAKEKFYYSVPEEADNSWAYQIPDCSPLAQKQTNSIVKCEKSGKNETCQTKEIVHLSNALDKKSKDFKLIYHVFASKPECIADREAALSED